MEEEKKIDPSAVTAGEKVEEKKVLTPEEAKMAQEKKMQNMVSAIILLAGLFVGSLFVDVIQMVRGGGFSQRALNSTDIFASNGKTWVAFSEPIVKVSVVTDDACGDACKPDEVLVGLKQALPTMLSQKIDANSTQGKKLISEFSIKTLPAFIFSTDIEKTDLFAKAQPFLDKQADGYAIRSAEAGFPVGKYVSAPTITDKDIKLGSDDAVVKVVTFSDFSNPADAAFYKSVMAPMLKDYADKIQFVFKNYFIQTNTVAQSAALASECANEQGKFAPYADKLFAGQAVWSKMKDATAVFNGYASQTGLKFADFSKCLSSKKYQDVVSASAQDGQAFGIQGTPSMFVGTDLQASGASYDDVKKAIDAQLAQ